MRLIPRPARLLPMLALAWATLAPMSLRAQSHSASQTVRFIVRPIVQIALSESSRDLVVEGTPADGVVEVVDEGVTYSIVSNRPRTRITAALDAPLPEGLRFELEVGSLLGESAGRVELTSAETVEVVSRIGQGQETDQPIRYHFSADLAYVGAVETTRTLVLTVTE